LAATLFGCDGSSGGNNSEFSAKLKQALNDFRNADAARSGIVVPGSAAGAYRPGEDTVTAVDGAGNIEEQMLLHNDSLFRIGSQTKMFAAALIFQLEQEGKVSIEDPIARYIDYPEGERITIRHLLGHTGGVVSFTDSNLRSALDELVEQYEFPSPAQLVQMCADSGLSDFEPGTSFSYSNTGYLILGLIAERIEGRPWHEQVRGRFLEPLKMNDTYLYGYEEGPEPITGYTVYCVDTDCAEKGLLAVTPGADAQFSWSTGGMISTAHDMAIWIHALVVGDLLQVAQRQKMQTLTPQSEVWAAETFGRGSPRGMGLGLFLYSIPEVGEAWGHSGRISGFGNIAAYFVANDFGVSNLNNLTEADSDASLTALAKAVVE
jgi:D-alanyl-D-alanine carboxypeptidase